MSAVDDKWLEQLIRSLLPPGPAIQVDTMAGDYVALLLPAERAATGGMVPNRLLEFARGRYCARAAMRKLGHPEQPVPKAEDRAPVWPAGLVGAISHTGTYAAAAVAPAENFAGIGLDLESAGPLDTDIAEMICRPDEEAHDGAAAKRLFGIKESIYKAIYPTVRRYVDFQEMGVVIDASTGRFVAEPHIKDFDADALAGLSGCFREERSLLICCAWLPRQ